MTRKTAALIFFALSTAVAVVALFAIAVIAAGFMSGDDKTTETSDTIRIEGYREDDSYKDIEINSKADAREVIDLYCRQTGTDKDEYTDAEIKYMADHPQTRDFILGIPASSGEEPGIDISTEPESNGIKVLYQWDKRWGYKEYGSNLMGYTGCGPTCLSMVASSLLGDDSITPAFVADYSMDNGYYDYVYESGTLWSLMTSGASGLGLDAEEIPLDEEMLIASLDSGCPAICIMGPGEFTKDGHFIVITGYEDGYYTINDPNSPENTSRKWLFDEFADQIQNIWVYRVIW